MSNENELPSYSVCIYDLYRGGLGYADKAYDLMDQIVRNAILLVEGCKCKDGCSVCVGDYHLDKNVVLWGLRSLYEEIQAPIVVKEIVEPTGTIAEKPFKACEINERWSEISGYIRQQGGNLADFISQITDARYEGGKLSLGVQFDFLKAWVMEHENQMRIKNILSQYIEFPVPVEVDAFTNADSNAITEGKLLKHYRELTTPQVDYDDEY